MGVLHDWFIAPDDEAAATAIGGVSGFPCVEDTGIDPTVMAGTLEELLTGRDQAEIEADPRTAEVLVLEDGERMVIPVTDTLRDALAGATDQQLDAVSGPWSQTEEFWGRGDPSVLAAGLRRFAALAREARSRGWRLYCWTSL